MSDLSIPLKRCSRGDRCVHADGPHLPANAEFFHRSQRHSDGLKPECKACRNQDGRDYSYRNGAEPLGRLYADGTKRCPNCGEFKLPTLEYFVANSDGLNGLHSVCRDCHSTHGKAYYAQNKEQITRRIAKYQSSRADWYRAYHQQWYVENREKVLQQCHARYRNNKEKYTEIKLRWKRANPYKSREYDAARRAKGAGLAFSFTSQQWIACLDWFSHTCAVCGRPVGLWHTLAQDHWMPVHLGGPTVALNIVPLCHGSRGGEGGCNRAKSANDPKEWLVRTYGKSKAAKIMARVEAYFEWVRQQSPA